MGILRPMLTTWALALRTLAARCGTRIRTGLAMQALRGLHASQHGWLGPEGACSQLLKDILQLGDAFLQGSSVGAELCKPG